MCRFQASLIVQEPDSFPESMFLDFTSGSAGKESTCNAGDCLLCGRYKFDPWVSKIIWRREWLPIPVFLPGEPHAQRNLAGYSPWDRKKLDMTERLILSPSELGR